MLKRMLSLIAVAVLVASCGNGVTFITPTAGQQFSLTQGANQGYYFTVTLNQYVGSTITFSPSPYLANLLLAPRRQEARRRVHLMVAITPPAFARAQILALSPSW